ncbi:MAG: hypothetical protein ACO1NZ_02635 [Adhaeribacter sp.]
MKKNLLLQIPLCFTMLLLLASCDQENNPAPNPATCALTNVALPGGVTLTYEYNAQKKLVKARYDDPQEEDYDQIFEYNAAGKVKKLTSASRNGAVTDYFAYTYNAQGLLTRESYYFLEEGENDFTHLYDRTYEYNAGNQVVKSYSFSAQNLNTPSRYLVYTHDAKGNVSKVMEYAGSGPNAVNDLTTEYTYDDKRNPNQAFYYDVSAKALSGHNLLSQKETYPLSGQVVQYNFAYQYNESGFPVQVTRTTPTSQQVSNLTYSCSN